MTATAGSTAFVLGGRYVVTGVLGRGAVGEVLAAHDTVLRRDVAVKVWRSADGDPVALERLAREARAAGRLCGANVVTVLDVDVRAEPPYLVMERLPGVTWADALRGPRPATATTASVLVDVLSALCAAHAAGVVHRDVKPANVLLTTDGRAKLGDFGIATLADDTRLTRSGDVLGSAPYVAPERLDGADPTGACDVWAVGVMAYEALAGRRPYDRDTPVLTVMAVLQGGHVPLAHLRPDLPADVLAAVDAALDRDPAARPTPQHLGAVLGSTLPVTDGPGDPALAAFVARATAAPGSRPPAAGGRAPRGTTVLVPLPLLGPGTGRPGRAGRGRRRRPARVMAPAVALLVAGAAGGLAAGLGLGDDAAPVSPGPGGAAPSAAAGAPAGGDPLPTSAAAGAATTADAPRRTVRVRAVVTSAAGGTSREAGTASSRAGTPPRTGATGPSTGTGNGNGGKAGAKGSGRSSGKPGKGSGKGGKQGKADAAG